MISAQQFFSILANIAYTQNNKNLAEKAKSRMGSSMPNSIKNIQIASFINDIRSSSNSSSWILTVSEFFSTQYFELNNAEQIEYTQWLAYLMNGDWLPEHSHKNNGEQISNSKNCTLEEIFVEKNALAHSQINHEFSYGFITTSKLLTFGIPKESALLKLNSIAFKRVLLASEGTVSNDPSIYSYDPLRLAICLNNAHNNHGNNYIINTLIGDIRKMSVRDSCETSDDTEPYITIETISNASLIKCKYSTKKHIFTESCELQLLLLQQFLEHHCSLNSMFSLLKLLMKFHYYRKNQSNTLNFWVASRTIYRQQVNAEKRIDAIHQANPQIMLIRYMECSCLLLNHQALVTNKALIIYQHLSKKFRLTFFKQRISLFIMYNFYLLHKSFNYKHKESEFRVPYSQKSHVNLVNEADLIISQVHQHNDMTIFHEFANTALYKQKLLQTKEKPTEYTLLDIIILKTLPKEEKDNITNPKVKVLMTKLDMLSFSDAINDETLTEDDRGYLLQYFSEAL